MTPTELEPFADACGLRRPIDLRVVRADGVVLAEGELDIPCAIVGRDPACEVTLTDADVSLRHACIQAVGGRVLVADIGSKAGLGIGGRRTQVAWLTPTDPVEIGQFRLTLRKPLFTRPTLPDASPLSGQPAAVARLPRVAVQFLNGKSVKARWVVDRPVTFVGRARECKITLSADDIAPYHCYFVLTPAGLWVVDLVTAAGVRVNGEAVRFALLAPGDRLKIGRFRLGIADPDDPADSKTTACIVSAPRVPAPVPAPAPAAALAVPTVDPALTPVVAQFAAAQNQMLEQFRQSMAGVFQMFGEMHREQVGSMQAEIARMAELNAEMQRLQSQLAAPAEVPASHLPDPADVPAMSEESAGQHNWVYERMTALQSERQTLWDRLTGLMTAGRVAGV